MPQLNLLPFMQSLQIPKQIDDEDFELVLCRLLFFSDKILDFLASESAFNKVRNHFIQFTMAPEITQ